MKSTAYESNNQSVTHIWERVNCRWLGAGAFSGIAAGLLIMIIGSIMAQIHYGEWTQAPKLFAAMCYGGDGLAYGSAPGIVIYGFLIHFFFSAIYGMTFAQLVNEESTTLSLMILGFVTALIIWVFGFRLFMPSWDYWLFAAVPGGLGILFHIIFGISFGWILSKSRPFFSI